MKNLKTILILLPIVLGCVDKIELSLPAENLPIIVDGMITDQPGPDTVRISRAYVANAPCDRGCECCTCRYTTREKAPILANSTSLAGSHVNSVLMQYIPINDFTYERYRVEITQMELSEDVFEFYQSIRKQHDNADNLFQPPLFELTGNVTVESGTQEILGTFAASAIVRKHYDIHRNEVPFALSGTPDPADCRSIADNATLNTPSYWQ